MPTGGSASKNGYQNFQYTKPNSLLKQDTSSFDFSKSEKPKSSGDDGFRQASIAPVKQQPQQIDINDQVDYGNRTAKKQAEIEAGASYKNLIPHMLQEIPKSVYKTLGDALKTDINKLTTSGKSKDEIPDTKSSLAKQYLTKVFGLDKDVNASDVLETINPTTAFNHLVEKVTQSSIPKESKEHAIKELGKASQWLEGRTQMMNEYQKNNPVPDNLVTSTAKGIAGMLPDLTLAGLGGVGKEATVGKYVSELTQKAPQVIAKYAPKAAELLERSLTAPFTKVMAAKGAVEGGAENKENPTLGFVEGGLKGAGEGVYMHILGEGASKAAPYISSLIGKSGATSEISTAIANPLSNAGVFMAGKTARTLATEGRLPTQEELAHEGAMGLGFSLLHAGSLYRNHAEANKFYDSILKTDPKVSLGRVLNDNIENVKENYNPDIDVKKLEEARDEIKDAIIKNPDMENKKELGFEAIKIQNQLDAKNAIDGIVSSKDGIVDMINKLPELSDAQKSEYIKKVDEIHREFDPVEKTKTELADYITQSDDIVKQHTDYAKQATDPIAKVESEILAKKTQEVSDKAKKELSRIIEGQMIPEEVKPEKQTENEKTTKIGERGTLQGSGSIGEEIRGEEPRSSSSSGNEEVRKGENGENGASGEKASSQSEEVTPKQTIQEGIGEKGLHTYNGEKGELKLDGQTVVFETKNKIYELGNKDEISNKDISELGVERDIPFKIKVNTDNSIEIDGKKYFNPKAEKSINYDENGDVKSISVEAESGQKRTIRGNKAEEIAYQYKLKQLEENGTEEQIDRAIKQTEKVIRTEGEVKPTESKEKIRNIEKSKIESNEKNDNEGMGEKPHGQETGQKGQVEGGIEKGTGNRQEGSGKVQQEGSTKEKVKEEENAIQKQITGEVLQRESEEAGKSGSERERVESGEQGKETAKQNKTEEKELAEDSLEKLSSYIPNGGEIKKYLSGDTIEKYEGSAPTNEQEYVKQELMPALQHGVKIINAAKEKYGDDFVGKTLDFIESNKGDIESKALMYVSLENELAKQKIEDPSRDLEISKLQDLVRSKSQAYLRKNAIEINMGRLRKIAEAGYDVNKVTSNFFSSEQSRSKKTIEKSIQADGETINKEADFFNKQSGEFISDDLESVISKGVDKQVNEIYKKLPTARRERADKAIAALDRIQKKLRSRTYDASIGVPVAIIDAGITTIKAAIKAGVNIADAIELGIAKIKEKHGKWAKEEQFRKDMLDGFKEEQIDTKEGSKVKMRTPAEKLADAKERIKSRIDDIRQQIIDKKRETESLGKKVRPDVELTRLQAEEKAISELRDKYLPKDTNLFTDEKKQETVAKKLMADIESINDQINKGEKNDREQKKDPYENEKINKLRAEKKARLDLLEQIDPTPKDFIESALIDKGFGREIKINGEVREVLDWRKLAGEEGSVDRIQRNVEESLKSKGFSEGEILRMQNSFVEEYNNLRASVIEKSLKEVESRNTPKEAIDLKTSAKRLAELYNYGLFEKESDTYDYLMNKSLGMSVTGQKTFFEAKELAKALSDLYNQKPQGETLSEMAIQPAVNNINHKITQLLNRIAWTESNWKFKAATVAKEYMGLSQRALLASMKQLEENVFSGYVERAFNKLTYMKEGSDTKALQQQRAEAARNIIKDVTLNAGMDYGNVNSPFLSRSMTEDLINGKSKSKAYHAAFTYMMGRVYLEGADSMHKTVLTEKLFVRQLIKVLTDPNNPSHFKDKQEAINYVSDKLTGQSFEDALTSAKEVISNVNKKAGKTVLPDNKESVYRLAQGIVKDALVKGERLTTKEVEASFNSAYKVAGYGMGHEANNPISRGVGMLNSHVEGMLKEAIKEKKWDSAARLTFESIITKNILNPFVGGGTNWVTLTLQKAGVDWYSVFADRNNKRDNPIDVTSAEGIKNLEKALTYDAKAKSTQGRVFIGAAAGLLTYAALKASGQEDNINSWLKKNEWAKKYFNVISPQALVFLLSMKDKEMGKYFTGLLNIKTDNFSEGKKLTEGSSSLIEGLSENDQAKKNKGLGKLGDVIGGKMSLPILPYKFTRDVQNIYRGITGQTQIKSDYKTSGFANGFYKNGFVDFLGLRPGASVVAPPTQKEIDKAIADAMKELNKKR